VLALFPSSPTSSSFFSGTFSTRRIFLHCVANFFPLQEKNAILAPPKPPDRTLDDAAGAPADAFRALDDASKVNFSLAFVGSAATMSQKFTTGCGGARLGQHGEAVSRTRGGEGEMHFAPVTKAAGTAGNAEGSTPLNAFDNALLAAGIGNINLIKVSSILPPGVELVALPRIKPGALVPTAYAAMTSEVPGEVVAAAVGWAQPEDPAKNGVIMEFHDKATREEAERMIVQMLEEAFRVRGEKIRDMKVFAVEHRVERTGCALAAVTLLSEDDLV
jgi:arginine decarboxylase